MSYTFHLTSHDDRVARIAAEKKTSDRVERHKFREQMTDLPRVRVPIDLPIYRMNNGRTVVRQHTHIQRNKLADDFFFAGQENETAQTAQHQVLLDLARTANRNIYVELGRVALQTESLLITCTGVIVNGNRRLAAMRDLYASDPKKFSEFAFVDVAVLPAEATEDDLEVIETELQMVRETKLDYGWIEVRLKMRRALDESKSDNPKAVVAARFKLTVTELTAHIQQLELAEEYLENEVDDELNYEIIATSEQNFKSLTEHLTKLGVNSASYNLDKKIGFLVIAGSSSLGTRSYDFIKSIKEYREIFAARAAHLALAPPEPSDKNTPTVAASAMDYAVDDDDWLFEDSPEDLFEESPDDRRADDEAATKASVIEAAVTALTRYEDRGHLRQMLVEAHGDARESNTSAETKEAPLKAAKAANSRLVTIEVGAANADTLDQLEGQLHAVRKTTDTLLAAVAKRRSALPG